MKLLPPMRRWFVPMLSGVAGLLGGFVAFHPGWTQAPALTDGTPAAFLSTAQQIAEGDLLSQASAKERVGWLLEICKQPTSLRRDRALYEAIQHLQPGDFLVAIADLQALAKEFGAMGNSIRAEFGQACVERWLDVDEASALRWLTTARIIVDTEALKIPGVGQYDLQGIYSVLARRNPDWAFEEAKKLGAKTGRETGIQTVLFECANRDARKAREWLQTFEGTADWKSAYKGYVYGLSQSDPVAAFEALHSHGGEPDDELTMNVIAAAAQRSSTMARELLSRVDPVRRSSVGWMALSFMQPADGADPLAFVQEQYAASKAEGGVAVTPNEWNWTAWLNPVMRRNAIGTMEWIQSLPGNDRDGMMESALQAWSRDDPAAMMDWIAKTPGVNLPKDMQALAKAVHQSPDRYSQWIAALPDNESRNRLRLAMAQDLIGRGQIAEALQTLPDTVEDGRQLEFCVAAIGPQKAVEARDLIGTVPEGTTKGYLIKGIVSQMAKENPAESAQWVESLPVGSARDSGVAALASSFVSSDPGAATVWIDQISDPTAREQAASECFLKLLGKSRPGARAWLAALPNVSDAAKQRMLASRW